MIVSHLWIGVDVSKKNLDCACWMGGKSYRGHKFANHGAGLAAMLSWIHALPGGRDARLCMESTGDYHTHAVLFFSEQGLGVAVVNPARIKHFGRELGRLTKTDKADARLIAQFAVERQPALSPMMDPARREFFRLVRRRGQLQKLISAELNRRDCPEAIGESCMASIKRTLKMLRAELRLIEASIRSAIQSHAKLRQDAELILSLGVVREPTVFTLLAEMPDVDECESAASYAASTGVQPTWKNSGSKDSASARMSKCGRSQARRGLFMTVFVSIRKLPELQALYERLKLRGRKHRQAVIACLRKFLMIVYGMLKHRQPYRSKIAT
jgi:transposase